MKTIFNILSVLVIISFIFSNITADVLKNFSVPAKIIEQVSVRQAHAAVATFELNPAVLVPLAVTSTNTTYNTWQGTPNATRQSTQNQTARSLKTGEPMEIPSGWEDAFGVVLGVGAGVASVGTSALSFDAVVKQIVRGLITNVANSLKNWARTGFKGQPSFVKNWKGMLNQAALTAANAVFSQIPANLQAIMCTPIDLTPPNISLKLGLRPTNRTFTKLGSSQSCNFNAVLNRFNRASAGFQNGCYRSGASGPTRNCWGRGGGLIASNMWEPQNNAAGMYLLAKDEQLVRTQSSVKAKQNDAMANKGFQSMLSWTDCVNDPNTGDESCNTQTPGGFVADTISQTNLGPFNNMMDMKEISDVINSLIGGLIQSLTQSVATSINGVIQNQVGSVRF